MSQQKFKYPLRITGTPQQLTDLVPELVKLGYIEQSLSSCMPYGDLLITDYLLNGRLTNISSTSSVQDNHRTFIDARDHELVLALAAALTDDNDFNTGEYVVVTEWGGTYLTHPDFKYNGTYGKTTPQNVPLKVVRKISFTSWPALELLDTRDGGNYLQSINISDGPILRKATKDELYKFFKEQKVQVEEPKVSQFVNAGTVAVDPKFTKPVTQDQVDGILLHQAMLEMTINRHEQVIKELQKQASPVNPPDEFPKLSNKYIRDHLAMQVNNSFKMSLDDCTFTWDIADRIREVEKPTKEKCVSTPPTFKVGDRILFLGKEFIELQIIGWTYHTNFNIIDTKTGYVIGYTTRHTGITKITEEELFRAGTPLGLNKNNYAVFC